MSKKKNYTNYYSKKTYEDRSNEKTYNKHVEELEEEKKNYYSEPEIEEEVVEEESKISPEEKIEKTEPKKAFPPRQADLIENLYIRESIDGPKVLKEDLDLIISSKVIKDRKGHAIVPKGTRVEVFDCTETENGTLWYSTRFGYLMAKTKSGKEYIKVVR